MSLVSFISSSALNSASTSFPGFGVEVDFLGVAFLTRLGFSGTTMFSSAEKSALTSFVLAGDLERVRAAMPLFEGDFDFAGVFFGVLASDRPRLLLLDGVFAGLATGFPFESSFVIFETVTHSSVFLPPGNHLS